MVPPHELIYGSLVVGLVAAMGGAQMTRQVCSIRYQGELLGLWDSQNRDLRRKPPPETKFLVG